VYLVAGFRVLPQITQPDFFIILRLGHNGFLPNPSQFIVDQSTCLSLGTVHSSEPSAALHTTQENESKQNLFTRILLRKFGSA